MASQEDFHPPTGVSSASSSNSGRSRSVELLAGKEVLHINAAPRVHKAAGRLVSWDLRNVRPAIFFCLWQTADAGPGPGSSSADPTC